VAKPTNADPKNKIVTTEKSQDITANIMHLFKTHGHADYDGEPVSQLSHMVQAGMQAHLQGYDNELIIGAFLHDIGHLLKDQPNTEDMGGFGIVNHEGLGAAYLVANGFSARVCAVVNKHVDAKRYLVATNEDYATKLSAASQQTLIYQGGPMTGCEAEMFAQHLYFDDIIQVRLWDEQSKEADLALYPLSFFEELINQHLQINKTK